LNLIERWFKELTDKRLRRGRFTSIADFTDAITRGLRCNADVHVAIDERRAEAG